MTSVIPEGSKVSQDADAATSEERHAAVYRPTVSTTSRIRRTALIVGVLAAAAMLARLFLGGTVGMADNYDGHRLTCQLDVIVHDADTRRAFEFITTRYDEHTWYGETCGSGGEVYASTARYLLEAAKAVTPLFGYAGALDLRVLGMICALLFGAATALLFVSLPLKTWMRALVTGLLAAATLDSTVALYFISPLNESAAIVGMVFVLAMMFRVVRRQQAHWADLLVLTGVTVFTVLAKTQTATVVLAVLPVLLLRPVKLPWQKKVPAPSGGGLLRGSVRGLLVRLPALALAGVLALTTGAYQAAKPIWFQEMYNYHQVFVELLPNSPTPQEDLAELGLPPRFVEHTGTRLNGTGLTWSDDYRLFYDQVNTPLLMSFYARHPERLIGMADRGMVGMVNGRASYLGNYAENTGNAPYAKDCRVCLISGAFHLVKPVRWVVFPALWFGSIGLGLWIATRRRLSPGLRGTGVILAGMSVATLAQFWAVMFSDGSNDLDKHMFFTWYGTALLLGLLLAALVALEQASRPVAGLAGVPGQPGSTPAKSGVRPHVPSPAKEDTDTGSGA
ncbi:hypothetical protein ACIO3O_16210 [Streptomyces sp. NPDC087440]|uniref:glycan biosynthesis hexose transferase WsfD n=1 Tax=Streptomyces sp. NPDC087440 TaxID=3365790 RepID=UPI00380BF237